MRALVPERQRKRSEIRPLCLPPEVRVSPPPVLTAGTVPGDPESSSPPWKDYKPRHSDICIRLKCIRFLLSQLFFVLFRFPITLTENAKSLSAFDHFHLLCGGSTRGCRAERLHLMYSIFRKLALTFSAKNNAKKGERVRRSVWEAWCSGTCQRRVTPAPAAKSEQFY